MTAGTQHLGAFFIAAVGIFVEVMRDASAFGAEKETSLAGTGDVKGGKARAIVALDASAHLVSAKIALKLPPCLWDAFYAVDGFHVDGIADAGFWDPHCTKEMCPFAGGGLFESAALVRTEDARDGAVGRDGAFAAQPLAFGDVGDAVTVLVNSEIAAIAEDDCVGILALAVIADSTLAVLTSFGIGVVGICPLSCNVGACTGTVACLWWDAFHQIKPLLFELVEDDLKDLVGDGIEAVLASVVVESIEPLLILLIHVILDLLLEVALDGFDVTNVIIRFDVFRAVIVAEGQRMRIDDTGRNLEDERLFWRYFAKADLRKRRGQGDVVGFGGYARHAGEARSACWFARLLLRGRG